MVSVQKITNSGQIYNIQYLKKLAALSCHGFGGCRAMCSAACHAGFLRDGRGHVFYFEAYGFQLVDSASADWRRALQAS